MTKITHALTHHAILAEFVDTHTGDRRAPPGNFAPHDDDQRVRLVRSGCISEDPVADLLDKAVTDMTRGELESAAVEAFRSSVGKISDDDLRRGLERHRAGAGGDDDDEDDDRDDLEGLTVAELKDLAEADKIDLGEAKLKAEIQATIRAHRAAQAQA